LNDSLADQELDFGIRRRIPRLLARLPSQLSADGLVQGLKDSRFEIRYQCGRALDYMKRHFPDLHYSPHVLMEVVRNELSVSMHIWRSRRIVEQGDSAEADHLGTGDGASNRNLEHVFSLLAVIFPREPVTAAYQALHQPDHMFRALALEYLENVLPQDVRERLWALIKETPVTTGAELAKIEAELVRAGSTLSAASKSHAAMLPAENGGEPEPDSR